MSKSFLCYIHKPGILTPELRVVACASEDLLPEAILAKLDVWPPFDVIEVYDPDDKPLFRYTHGGRLAH